MQRLGAGGAARASKRTRTEVQGAPRNDDARERAVPTTLFVDAADASAANLTNAKKDYRTCMDCGH